jgi:hypothetical protein
VDQSDAIRDGVRQALAGYPKPKVSSAILQLAADFWVERDLEEEDFVECAKASYQKALRVWRE